MWARARPFLATALLTWCAGGTSEAAAQDKQSNPDIEEEPTGTLTPQPTGTLTPPQRLRAAVWNRPPDSSAFLARLRGQTVDLPVDLIEASSELPDQPLDAQVRAALELARAAHARIVVWRSGGDVLLFLASASPTRLLVRTVKTDSAEATPTAQATPPHSPQSAGLESAALIVRTALMAVLRGDTFGEPQVSSTVMAPPAVVPTAVSARPAFFVFMLGDARIASDGIADRDQLGLGLHLGVGWHRFSAGFTGMTSQERDVGVFHPQPSWQRNLAAFVGWRVLEGGPYSLTAEVASGISLSYLYRIKGSQREVHQLYSLEIRGGVDVIAVGRWRVPLWCGVGADYIPGAPPFTLEADGPLVWETKKLQPRFMVGTGLQF